MRAQCFKWVTVGKLLFPDRVVAGLLQVAAALCKTRQIYPTTACSAVHLQPRLLPLQMFLDFGLS
jgi:hypothetical protein